MTIVSVKWSTGSRKWGREPRVTKIRGLLEEDVSIEKSYSNPYFRASLRTISSIVSCAICNKATLATSYWCSLIKNIAWILSFCILGCVSLFSTFMIACILFLLSVVCSSMHVLSEFMERMHPKSLTEWIGVFCTWDLFLIGKIRCLRLVVCIRYFIVFRLTTQVPSMS